jgi:hypothetical protein
MIKKQKVLFVGLIFILFGCLYGPGQNPEVGPLVSMKLSEGALSPGFSPGRTQYWVRVDFAVSSLSFTPIAQNPEAMIQVAGQPVRNGQSSPPLPLAVGRNIIAVEVKGKHGDPDFVYKINVRRELEVPTWVQVASRNSWVPRDSCGELVFDGKMWLFGGYTPKVVGDIWTSKDGTDWIPYGTFPSPAGVNIPVNFVFRGKMWLTDNKDAFYMSADGKTWEQVAAGIPPFGRAGAGGAVFRDRMWILGGRKGSAVYNDVWSSSDGVNWMCELKEAPWSRRHFFGVLVVVFKDKLWILGGAIQAYHPFRAYTDVWSSSDGRNWTKVSDGPWLPRMWNTAVVYRDRMWLIGGFRADPTWNNFNDVWYSADGVNWRQMLSPRVWSPRHELSAYVFKDMIWVVGGNAWPLMNDVWSLEIPGFVFLSQPPIEEFVGCPYAYQAFADFNPSGKSVSYRIVLGPGWLSVDAGTGWVRGVPPEIGDFPVVIEASGGAGQTVRQSFTIHVLSL